MHIYAFQVPAEFFRIVLGPHLKYSCGLFRSAWELFFNVHFHKRFCRLLKLFLENVIAFWCLGHLPNISISRSSSATLTEAEEAMLEVYVERAQLKWAQNHKIGHNFFLQIVHCSGQGWDGSSRPWLWLGLRSSIPCCEVYIWVTLMISPRYLLWYIIILQVPRQQGEGPVQLEPTEGVHRGAGQGEGHHQP